MLFIFSVIWSCFWAKASTHVSETSIKVAFDDKLCSTYPIAHNHVWDLYFLHGTAKCLHFNTSSNQLNLFLVDSILWVNPWLLFNKIHFIAQVQLPHPSKVDAPQLQVNVCSSDSSQWKRQGLQEPLRQSQACWLKHPQQEGLCKFSYKNGRKLRSLSTSAISLSYKVDSSPSHYTSLEPTINHPLSCNNDILIVCLNKVDFCTFTMSHGDATWGKWKVPKISLGSALYTIDFEGNTTIR